jgi:hypothetical protein
MHRLVRMLVVSTVISIVGSARPAAAQPQFTLNITLPTGGNVAVIDPSTGAVKQTCGLSNGQTYTACTVNTPAPLVTLRAIESGAAFVRWQGACAGAGTNSTCVVRFEELTEVAKAGQKPASKTKTVGTTFRYPTITINPLKHASFKAVTGATTIVDCPYTATQCGGSAPLQSPVTITLTPDEGWANAGWTGACNGSTSNTCAFTLTNNVTLAPTLTCATYTVTVVPPDAEGGTVVWGQGGTDTRWGCGRKATKCSAGWSGQGGSWVFGVDLHSNTVLKGWGGSCAGQSGPTCTINAGSTFGAHVSAGLQCAGRSDLNVSATIAVNPGHTVAPAGTMWTLTISPKPVGGYVVSNAAALTYCGDTPTVFPSVCTAQTADDTTVSFLAMAAPGYEFAHWTGDCASTGTQLGCSYTGLGKNLTVSAVFRKQ